MLIMKNLAKFVYRQVHLTCAAMQIPTKGTTTLKAFITLKLISEPKFEHGRRLFYSSE